MHLRAESPRRRLARLALRAALLLPLLGCSSTATSTVAPEVRDRLSKQWLLYVNQDPKWPAAREAWLAGPQLERELLLDNLLRELMSDDASARGDHTSVRSTRARKELTWFGSDAVAPIAQGLRDLGAKPRVDVVVLDRLASGLCELHAVGELAALAAPDPGGKLSLNARLAALRALASLDDDAVQSALLERLRGDPDWQVRAAAARHLRRHAADPETRKALVAAIGDSDGFVRAEAVRGVVLGTSIDADRAPVAPLLHFMATDPAPAARAAAAESLAVWAWVPEVEAALVAALRDPDIGVVGKAAQGLLNCKTQPVQLALVDALEAWNRESLVDPGKSGLVSELLRILAANVGATPKRINPAGWRALIAERGAGK